MKSTLIAIALIAASSTAFADKWTGQDKKLHLVVGATIAGTVQHATDSKWKALAVATTAAIAKEVYDSRHPLKHTTSYKDLLVTVAGAGIATNVPGLTVLPGAIIYKRSF